MPHLSPMHWLLALLSATTLLLMMTSTMWWTQKPLFITNKQTINKNHTKWNWL